jgi:Fic family protein
VQTKKEKKTGRSSKVVPKGMQSLQRKINVDSAEIEGEEAPKRGLQRKINTDSAEIEGEEAPKGGLQRKVSADTPKNKRWSRKINDKEIWVIPKGMKAMIMASNMYFDIHLHDTLNHDIWIHKHSFRHT